MDCERCREVVSADLDGEATVQECRAVDEHLRGCRDCRAWADAAAAVTRRARTRPVAKNPDFAPGVVHALEHGWPAHDDEADISAARPDAYRRHANRHLVLLDGSESIASVCGCVITCRCGCQQGRPCRCGDTRVA